MQTIIDKHGSIRRLMEAYWTGQLSIEEETVIENFVPPERIYGFKPIDFRSKIVRLERAN